MIKQTLIILLIPLVISLSQNKAINNFTVEQSVSTSAKTPGEKSGITFTIRSEEFELYKISRDIEYDEPFPSANVFADGSAAVYYSFDGRVEFFDNSGNPGEDVSLYKLPLPDYERSIISSVSNDILALLISDSNSDSCEVVIVNNQGELVNRFFVTGEFASGVIISRQNDLIAVSTYSWENDTLIDKISLFTLDGKIIRSIPGQFNTAKIIDNVLLGFTNKNYFSIELDDLSSIDYGQVAEDELLLDMIMHNGVMYISTSNYPELNNGQWFYNSATVYIMSNYMQDKKSFELPVYNFTDFSFYIISDRVNALVDQKRFSFE